MIHPSNPKLETPHKHDELLGIFFRHQHHLYLYRDVVSSQAAKTREQGTIFFFRIGNMMNHSTLHK